jgi:Rrf2 family protein
VKLSTQEEYGLRCLLQLARQEGSLTIAEMSQREGISSPNVAKILRVLRRSGLVQSIRGKAGGYALARTADQIRVGEALAALGGRLFDGTFCERHSGLGHPCLNNSDCSIRPVLRHVQLAIDQVLAELTLKSLLCNEREMTVAMEPRGIPLRMAARPS